MKFILQSILVLLVSVQGFCSDNTIKTCQVTPAIWADFPPPNFTTSNNLRKKNGSYKFANGDFINIIGKVFDQNCIPVTGAVVRIWQANAYGVFEDDDKIFDNKDENFAGSGTSITNNLGEYSFFTVMPGAFKNRAPHIKFSIYHKDLPVFETEMFFPNQNLTDKDLVLKKHINANDRKLLLAKHIGYDTIKNADIYEFYITLEGRLNYKQY